MVLMNNRASASKIAPQTKANVAQPQKLSLPTKPVPPEDDIGNMTLLIHGEQGIGKTSFAAQFEDPLFLMFEPGGKGLSIKRVQINGWADTQAKMTPTGVLTCSVDYAIKEILKSEGNQTIVFDTADLAFNMCQQWVTSEAGEDYINEGKLGYGKGAAKLDTAFQEQILKVTNSGRGVIFISHTGDKEFEVSTGAKYNKLIPTMPERARKFIKGFADVAGYYGYFGDERFFVIRGSDRVDAKNRLRDRFRTTKGEPIYSIPMGNDEKEAYENFLKAFNNKQIEPYEQKRKADLSERKVKFKIK